MLAGLRAVLTDLDDTLTVAGRLPAASLAALEELQAAGVPVVVVTGRPAGWCDHIARMWPVAGVVGENGALWMRYVADRRRMLRSPPQPGELRRTRARLTQLSRTILDAVPGAAVAADQPFRLYDLAVDVAEDVPPLGQGEVDEICRLARAAGATCKVSSIHVNCWFGSYTKLDGVQALLAELVSSKAIPRPAGREQLDGIGYVGDSPNDEPLFAAAGFSLGVANVAPFLKHMRHPPAFITRARGGLGFAEFTRRLLECRRRPAP